MPSTLSHDLLPSGRHLPAVSLVPMQVSTWGPHSCTQAWVWEPDCFVENIKGFFSEHWFGVLLEM